MRETLYIDKHNALLTFLKETAALRRKGVSAYEKDDKTLWFGQLSKDYLEIHSIFFAENLEGFSNSWLEVCGKRKPIFPRISEIVSKWLPQKFLDNPEKYLSKKLDGNLFESENLNSTYTVKKLYRELLKLVRILE